MAKRRHEEKFSQILNLLTEDEIAKVVGMKHDLALNTFKLGTLLTVKNPEEFHQLLHSYIQHHYKTIGKQFLSHEINDIETKAIESGFGRGGMEEAYEMARTGIKGGLHPIIDKLYQYIKDEEVRQYINTIIDSHVERLDWNAKVNLMKEYNKRYGQYIPEGTMKSPEALAANYKELIWKASQVYNKMREGKIEH